MQNYHRHTSYSNVFIADSAAVNEDYAKRAVELGHKIISSVECDSKRRHIRHTCIIKKITYI